MTMTKPLLSAMCLLASAVFPLFAASPSDAPRPANLEIPFDEATRQLDLIKVRIFQKDTVDSEYPPAFWERRDDVKNQVLSAIEISSFANEMDFMSKTLNVEEATKTPRSWFVDLAASLKRLASSRFAMEDALGNKQRNVYFKAQAAYLNELDSLALLLKNRPALSPDELKKVKDDNDRKRKAISPPPQGK